jgi:hypothetical protein
MESANDFFIRNKRKVLDRAASLPTARNTRWVTVEPKSPADAQESMYLSAHAVLPSSSMCVKTSVYEAPCRDRTRSCPFSGYVFNAYYSDSHLDWCTHSNFPVPTSPALKGSSTHRPKVVRSRVESRSHRHEYYPDTNTNTNTNTNTFVLHPTLSARPPLRRLGFHTTLGGPRRQVHGAACTSTPRDCQNHHC